MLKLCILLYADDIVLFGNSATELQNSIHILEEYCQKWKLKVNVTKTKVVIFRKGGRLPNGLRFITKGLKLKLSLNFRILGLYSLRGIM